MYIFYFVQLRRKNKNKISNNNFSKTYVLHFRLRVLENTVLRRIFGHKRDEVMGEWRKSHSGELYNLYSSPDIIRQIKSRRMR
jgi:hypothetical protein